MGIYHVIQNLAEIEQIQRSFIVLLAVVKHNIQGRVNNNLPVPDSRSKTLKNGDIVRLNLPKLQQLETGYLTSAVQAQRGVFKVLVCVKLPNLLIVDKREDKNLHLIF